MNAGGMDIKIKEHEYTLLGEIAKNSLVTQSSLAKHLGIAVGSVNWYIKRLITRGWVKVTHLDRTRLKYDITPEGLTVFSQRAVLYARDSLNMYTQLREKSKKLIVELQALGISEVRLSGSDEIMDILRLSCIEAGIQINASSDRCAVEFIGENYQMKLEEA